MKKLTLIAMTAAVSMASVADVKARDYISVVGSSTVYPFATVVAERFGRTSGLKTPKIESTGSGGGMKMFCQGVGVSTPDITNASRRMKESEFKMCQKNGVTDIVEVLVGYDGIVLGNAKSATQLNLTRKEIFMALAAKVPAQDGSETLVDNPYTHWNQINASLPATKISVWGPPPTSGTRDAFAELALEGGCKGFAWIKAMKKTDKNQYKAICHTVREDGAYMEAGENDNLIVQKLNANKDALGIFGFSFLDQNAEMIQGSVIDGFEPSFDAIADGDYAVSRPLYFYVKKAHIGTVPGIQEYLNEFVSENASGEEGYLTDRGLIPLSEDKHSDVALSAKELASMAL